MVIVLPGVHQNFFYLGSLALFVMALNRLTDRRCLDELGPGADYADDFHL